MNAKMLTRRALVATVSLALISPTVSMANTVEEKPTALAMFGDMAIARPLLLGTTVVGLATFIVTLPFSAAGGNMDEAAKNLVVEPAKATFVRCLGCVRSGYKKRVEEDDIEPSAQ